MMKSRKLNELVKGLQYNQGTSVDIRDNENKLIARMEINWLKNLINNFVWGSELAIISDVKTLKLINFVNHEDITEKIENFKKWADEEDEEEA